VRKGRTPEELGGTLGPGDPELGSAADRDAGRRQDGLTTVESEEPRRLRREDRALREERESLRKAAAWSPREATSVPSKDSSS